MKKFVFRIALFAMFMIFFYISMLIVFSRFVPSEFEKNIIIMGRGGFTSQRLAEAKKTKNVDVLIVGSSHAYRGYDPRIFRQSGFLAFNLGTSSQSPLQTYYLLKKYIDNLNPEFVIVDINPLLLNNDGVESEVDLISAGIIDKETFKIAFRLNDIRIYNSLLLNMLNKKLHFKQSEGIPGDNDYTYIPGGYAQSYKSEKMSNKKANYKISVTPLQFGALKDMLNLLKDKHIKYVLVQTPLPRFYYNACINNESTDKILAGLGKYYNFNKVLNLPNGMYFDNNHLNQYGANHFNVILIDTLKKQGYLNTHKGDYLKFSPAGN